MCVSVCVSRVQNKVKKFGRPFVRTKSILIGHLLKMVRQKVFSFLVALICTCITLHEYFIAIITRGNRTPGSLSKVSTRCCAS